ncbi:hypothetical protein CU048_10545 [Beijerinckiaceae bacterium]|nr:hypothetical protein CU048_10545 [Beijerinckiaceae bacterium]
METLRPISAAAARHILRNWFIVYLILEPSFGHASRVPIHGRSHEGAAGQLKSAAWQPARDAGDELRFVEVG